MRSVDTIYDILNIIEEGILNNNKDDHYIIYEYDSQLRIRK